MHYYGYNGIRYDVMRLWKIAKHNPVFEISLSKFAPMFNSKPWKDDHGERFGPIDVFNDGPRFPEHLERIHAADLSYPILIEHDFQIIDGFHRMAKAVYNHRKHNKHTKTTEGKIKARILSPEQLQYGMYQNLFGASPRLIYSCSPKKLDKITPTVSNRYRKPICFGTPYQWMGVIMGATDPAGKRWTDTEISVGLVTENGDRYPLVKELQPGCFKRYLSGPMYIYTVSDPSFESRDYHPSYCYFITHKTINILNVIHIPNSYVWLKEQLGKRLVHHDHSTE